MKKQNKVKHLKHHFNKALLEWVEQVNYDTYLERFASKCKNLTSVDLYGTGVTDKGVEVLATNNKNLTRVGLIGTGVSQEMKNKLKEKGINVY